jgi:hypothetical protein
VSNWESQPGDSLSHHEIGKPNGQPRQWFFWTVRNESKGTPTRIVGGSRTDRLVPRISRARPCAVTAVTGIANGRIKLSRLPNHLSAGGKGGWVGGWEEEEEEEEKKNVAENAHISGAPLCHSGGHLTRANDLPVHLRPASSPLRVRRTTTSVFSGIVTA